MKYRYASDDHRLAADRLAELFGLYNNFLLRFLMKKLGSEQEAQDVAQEAYVKLLGLENKNVISHVQTYLFRTANNIAIDRLRSRNRSVKRPVEDDKRLQHIGGIVENLPPRCRQAFFLYRFKGLSYKEIASRMQLTESIVRKYVMRAICYCQERMER